MRRSRVAAPVVPASRRRARTWRSAWLIGAVVTTLLASACARRTVLLPPPITTPRFPDFVFPEVPPALRASNLATQHGLAWRWLQAGEPRNAENMFTFVLEQSPAFYPSETGLGFVELATGEYEEAVAWFARALKQVSTYAPALVGRGEALLALNRDQEALSSFETALTVDASLELPKRRVELLQFRLLQASLSNARKAGEAGRYDEAILAYQQAIAASPQSAFLYREIAGVERQRGDSDAAFEHYRKAVDLDPNDAPAWREIGEILEAREEHAAAIEAYTQVVTLEPSPAIQDRIGRLQALLALARLPAEYRALAQSAALTRGELAALIGVRFEKLLEGVRTRAVVVTDTRGHWAAPWIFAVTRSGIMDVYPNHTFQPLSLIRRSDLAQSVSQLLNLIAPRRPALALQWQAERRPIADVSPANLNYSAVSLAVASGVMPPLEGNTFQLSREVSGAEALTALDRLQALIP